MKNIEPNRTKNFYLLNQTFINRYLISKTSEMESGLPKTKIDLKYKILNCDLFKLKKKIFLILMNENNNLRDSLFYNFGKKYQGPLTQDVLPMCMIVCVKVIPEMALLEMQES